MAERPRDLARRMRQEALASAKSSRSSADEISGVNFGVAETGTILILENEGNIRLTTSLPKIHIAVMGIEIDDRHPFHPVHGAGVLRSDRHVDRRRSAVAWRAPCPAPPD